MSGERVVNLAAGDQEVLAEIKQIALAHLDLASPELLSGDLQDVLRLRLVDDLALDSIQLLTLAVEVEDHFQVALDGFASGEVEEVADVSTAGDADDESGEQSTEAEVATIGDLLKLLREQLDHTATHSKSDQVGQAEQA